MGERAPPDLVHHQVAVPLEQAHHRLQPGDRLPLLANTDRQRPDQFEAAGPVTVTEPADHHLLQQALQV